MAICSGRGIGKSAFLAMVNYWVLSCWLGATSIITANTETQLRTRTMAEIGKWHGFAINGHWYDKTALSIKPNKEFKELKILSNQPENAHRQKRQAYLSTNFEPHNNSILNQSLVETLIIL
jgi:hypothetical protein